LANRPKAPIDEIRQLREAENVLSSYSHAIDLLAEALQNATDAIDSRSEAESQAPRKIRIAFDADRRRFTVVDTGTGISKDNLKVVLTPNVTLKSGKLAPPRSGRSRGEKGVGLSFLVLASNYLHIQTCDGKERHDLVVKDANRWVQTEGETERPVGKMTDDEADEMLGSSRYTSVTMGDVDPDAFDEDLFSIREEELDWKLRTRTAVGNTAHLFSSLDRPQPIDIDITVQFRGGSSEEEWKQLPYRYATPEDLVPDLPVVDAENLESLSYTEIAEQTRGKGVRYVAQFETASGHDVDLYAFIVHGRDMNRMLEATTEEDQFVPDEWQSIEVATRNMPTGVKLRGGVIQPRSLERRVFVLLQYDELKLDLGRKTLAGQTSRMLRGVLADAWEEDLRAIIPRVGPAERKTSNVGKASLRSAIKRGLERRDLPIGLPYIKAPAEAVGVLALFHELLGAGRYQVPLLRTLQSGVFGETDSLIFLGEPNGVPPRHVLFAADARALIELLENEEQRTETVDMAVVWELDGQYLESQGIEHREARDTHTGTTHLIELAGIGGKDTLELMVLSDVLDEQA
jgi:hypothetical protein